MLRGPKFLYCAVSVHILTIDLEKPESILSEDSKKSSLNVAVSEKSY